MPYQERLSQWETEVSTAFAHLSKPQIWGLVLWNCRDYANQCSAFVSAVSRRTNRLSALTGVVSGCRTKKWKQAA